MRLIDADALKKDLSENYTFYGFGQLMNDFYEALDSAPSIDIVRCKECRWGKPYSDKQLECDALGLGGLKFPDDFCSYGEREGE